MQSTEFGPQVARAPRPSFFARASARSARTKAFSIVLALLVLVSQHAAPFLSNARALPILTVSPITWDVIGLDSNRVNDGPADIRQRVEDGSSRTDFWRDHYRAVAVLIAVDEAYSPQVIGQAILQTEAPVKLNDFEEALVGVTGDQTVRELFGMGP